MADSSHAKTSLAALAGNLRLCGLATDTQRLAHLEPLAASLFQDGERLTLRVDLGEPLPSFNLGDTVRFEREVR